MRPSVFELESRGLREGTRDLGDENLALVRTSKDARRCVDRDPADVTAHELDLADVDSARTPSPALLAALRTVAAQCNARAGPSNVASRPSPVVFDLPTAEAVERCSYRREVRGQTHAPGEVTECRGHRRRVDQIGEEERRQGSAAARTGRPMKVCILVHSSCTNGSSPSTHPSCPGGTSSTSFGPTSNVVPSASMISARPDSTTPTWRA